MASSKRLRVVAASCQHTWDIEIKSSDASKSLLELLIEHRIPIGHSCGGNGTCGTCRLILVTASQNNQPQQSTQEQEFWSSRGYPPSHPERLSCQIPVNQLPPDCWANLIE